MTNLHEDLDDISINRVLLTAQINAVSYCQDLLRRYNGREAKDYINDFKLQLERELDGGDESRRTENSKN